MLYDDETGEYDWDENIVQIEKVSEKLKTIISLLKQFPNWGHIISASCDEVNVGEDIDKRSFLLKSKDFTRRILKVR